MGNTTDFTGTALEPLMGDGMFDRFRPIFRGTLIANVKMDAERGNRLIEAGLADMVAFGRPYIANPDLVERLAARAAGRGGLVHGLWFGPARLFRLSRHAPRQCLTHVERRF